MTYEPESGSESSRQPKGPIPVPPLNQEIVAMIAHELRSPLAVISNVLTVCRASVVPTAIPAAGAVLDRQVKRALRLVNDLMDLTRLSDEGARFDRAPVDLACVVLNAAQDLEHEVRVRRQELALELLAEALWVRGDAARLEQIVGNLLENSCKYSPDGGRIVLSLSHQEDQAVLCVRDDGSGISSEDLPRIFEPYFRGSNSAQAAHGGLGLGLTLTQRLVKLHGGTIEVKSRGAGCGSEFTVRLPASGTERDPARTEP
jgi:signal transduction histidine kinase